MVCEPVGTSSPRPRLLREMIDLAHSHGALCVFDEVIRAFALHLAERRSTSTSKRTWSASARRSAMACRYPRLPALQAHGWSSRCLLLGYPWRRDALTGGRAATLDVIAREPVHEHLWRLGRRLAGGRLAHAIERMDLGAWVQLLGRGPVDHRERARARPDATTLAAKSLMQQEMIKRGILFNGSNFISYAHTEADID